MATIYVMRGRGAGVMTDKAFAKFPTEGQIAEALEKEMALHGIKDGKPRTCWVKVQTMELDGGAPSSPAPEGASFHYEASLTQEEVDAMLAAGPPGTMVAGVGMMVPEGEGSVVNPGDPGWTDRSAEKIVARDVGSVDDVLKG